MRQQSSRFHKYRRLTSFSAGPILRHNTWRIETHVKTNFAAAGVLSVWFVFLLLLGISGSNSPTLLAAQSDAIDDVKRDTPDKVIHPGQSVHIDVGLALVNVTVTDPYDRVVTGLELDNFRVFENNVEQEIQYFSSEDVPISIGVIFDLSGSMANKIGQAKEATLQFFKTANRQDEFFLVSFNDRAELISAFTNSADDLQSPLLSASGKGRTALLDAIYLGHSEMHTARNNKRALLIISKLMFWKPWKPAPLRKSFERPDTWVTF